MSCRWLIPFALLVTGCGKSSDANTESSTVTSTAMATPDPSFTDSTPLTGNIAAATKSDLASKDASVGPTVDNEPAGRGDQGGKAALPADVTAYRARRDQCDHFRGEEAEDDVRAAQLEKALNRTCKGTDAELIKLRGKYAGNKAVIAALAEYESEVE